MDIKQVVSIWGAIWGALGPVIAGYAVWLTKRSQNSKVVLENVRFKETEKGNFGASIDFTVSVANIGFKQTTVTGFYIDLGKDLNSKYEGKETKSNFGLLKFRHTIPTGVKINGEVVKRPTHNEPLQVLPGSHEGPIHLACHIMYEDKDNGEYSKAINELIRNNRFSISVCTTGNKLTSFPGKSLEEGVRKFV